MSSKHTYLDCTVKLSDHRLTITHEDPSFRCYSIPVSDWWSPERLKYITYKEARWKNIIQMGLDKGFTLKPLEYNPTSYSAKFVGGPRFTIFYNLDRISINKTTYLLSVATLEENLERILPSVLPS